MFSQVFSGIPFSETYQKAALGFSHFTVLLNDLYLPGLAHFYWLTNFLTSQVITTLREYFLSSVFCNLISKLMNSPLIKINKNTSRSPIIIVCSLILNI
jgi:hypothetical protein